MREDHIRPKPIYKLDYNFKSKNMQFSFLFQFWFGSTVRVFYDKAVVDDTLEQSFLY